MQLLKLVESEIQMDVALPWNVRNHDCTLLLARGHIVSSEAQMQALLERGIYVDLEEKRAVEALYVPKSGPVKSIYTRWPIPSTPWKHWCTSCRMRRNSPPT